jgi:hypothetical protein
MCELTPTEPMQLMTHNVSRQLALLQRDNHDDCCNCRRTFQEGDTSHLGYDKNGKPLYVGDCCSNLLAETAIRHYFTPRPYEVPPNHAVLWRYMDLAKLLSLLKDSALHFVRADRFVDPFEGAKGVLSRKPKWDAYYLAFFHHIIRNPPEGYPFNLTDDQVTERANDLLAQTAKSGEFARKSTFISCWHESEHENEALWYRYGGSDACQSVAIRTTFRDLQLAIGDDPYIPIGRVKYIDIDREYAEINGAFFRKRLAFKHEREVRAIINAYQNPPEFVFSRPVDVNVLVNEIVVSPLAPNWYEDVVRDAVARYSFSKGVSRSRLADKPFY